MIEKETKEPSLKERVNTELEKFRAHPSSASVAPEHLIKLLELLAQSVQ